MDKELQQALAAILNKTSGAIESGVVFLQGQLPDVIHQLLVWKAVQSGLAFSALLPICVLTALATKRLWREFKESDYRDGPLFVFPGGACFISFGLLLSSLGWLQIILAPKIYLIEYAASLAK